jgi:hypothetical protein
MKHLDKFNDIKKYSNYTYFNDLEIKEVFDKVLKYLKTKNKYIRSNGDYIQMHSAELSMLFDAQLKLYLTIDEEYVDAGDEDYTLKYINLYISNTHTYDEYIVATYKDGTIDDIVNDIINHYNIIKVKFDEINSAGVIIDVNLNYIKTTYEKK